MLILRVATALVAVLTIPSSCIDALPSSPQGTVSAANLDSDAPSAKELGGVHLLMENDVDSSTPKYPVILLSKPRAYKDAEAACASLGEPLVDATYGNLPRLLDITPVAQSELKGARYFWINADVECTALDRRSGETRQFPCTSVQLPALCTNSLPRTTFLTWDKSQQIKVEIPNMGTWQGYRDRDQFRFQGIPFAEPPVKGLRFMGPEAIRDLGKFEGQVNDATKFSHACMQLTFSQLVRSMSPVSLITGAEESEDCLYLNVYTPSLKDGKPGNLVSRAGVVVVIINYRLGIFGSFENTPEIPRSKAPGNLNFRDQIAALEWVQRNIAAFGGDPSQVTIFGESSGAYSMRALLSVPSAFDLYRNAISQSDQMGIPFSNVADSSRMGNLTMHFLNCQSPDLDCALSKTAAEVKSAQIKTISVLLNSTSTAWLPDGALFRPTVDGDLFSADFADLVRSGQYNTKANILWGTTRDESASFIPTYIPLPVPVSDLDKVIGKALREERTHALLQSPYYQLNTSDPDTVRNVLSNASSDFYFNCPLQVMSQGIITHRSGLYVYKMKHGIPLVRNYPLFCSGRVCHFDDVIPSFGSGDVLPLSEQTGDDARFARQVIDRFTTFARYDDPNPKKGQPGLAVENPDLMGVQWPTYAKSDPVLQIELDNSTVLNDVETSRCDWIQRHVPYEYQVHSPDGHFVPIYPSRPRHKPSRSHKPRFK
ncbi:Alpha/Beta hydrolase protein [Gamsiella multidivaricata]|uniref:Alpha/Beta hydrolase protein n=1 Tax=Gamsiella multidivaricata TaxID=101098 RepID=UPI00221F281E|nr:Alpha/Beta hydrolase protein [Gamsiella multidivaricata]KAI7828716.1 Alpha/Beta hydrolase protein [Gamsiella multidivaricata]